MTAAQFTLIFIAALALTTLAKLWLARRHLAHIAAHRAAVPNAFHDKVQLGDHQKAADYTSAKTRFDMLGALFDAALLLAFTLAGGIQYIADLCNGWFGAPIAQGMATHRRGAGDCIRCWKPRSISTAPSSSRRVSVSTK